MALYECSNTVIILFYTIQNLKISVEHFGTTIKTLKSYLVNSIHLLLDSL
jgi:hypothetical protein